MIEAVVFDLDGVLLDTEELWNEARRQITDERGGRWRDDAQRAMMGMSSPEWSRYMHDVLGVPDPPEEISAEVVKRLEALYRERLPLVPGALEAVRRIGERWPLGIASSSNRPLIDLFLELTGTGKVFRATVSSEEVERGKPAPDVYVEAARRLGVSPATCAAIEDSENGIRSAAAAGMRVIAIPNRVFPPSDEALSLAHVVLGSLEELTPEVIEGVEGRSARPYLRPTSRLTGKPLRLTAPGRGLCPMTRPRSERLVRTRRTRPTEQLALRIRCLAAPSRNPMTRGTRQRA